MFNAFKHLFIFCPLDPHALKQLSLAQATWAMALLGWEPDLSGLAAIGDIGWLHITMESLAVRCSLLARMKDLSPSPVS